MKKIKMVILTMLVLSALSVSTSTFAQEQNRRLDDSAFWGVNPETTNPFSPGYQPPAPAPTPEDYAHIAEVVGLAVLDAAID